MNIRRLPGRASLVAALALPAIAAALYVGSRPTTSPSPVAGGASARPSAVGAAAFPIDPATCALERQPGPADKAPDRNPDNGIDAGADLADVGNGRWRLCQTEPFAQALEGSAWCTWDDERTVVSAISGLDVPADDQTRTGANIELDTPRVSLFAIRQNASVDFTETRHVDVQPAADGRSGASTFALGARRDPDHPAAVPPADRVGTIRWNCGDPPPFRSGRATGRVDLRLDAPVAGQWQVAAKCDWVSSATGPRVLQVETYPPDIQRAGARIGMTIRPEPADPDRTETSLWVDRTTAGDSYQSNEGVIAVRIARDGSTGLVRMPHLFIDPNSDVRIEGDLTDVAGVVSWTCPPPHVAGPVDDPGPVGAGPEVHRGHAIVSLTGITVAPIAGDITCEVDRTNAPQLVVSRVRAALPLPGGGRVEVRAGDGRVLLAIVGVDGQPGGEYAGAVTAYSDDPSQPSLHMVVNELKFGPVDPRYVPFGGPGGPRTVGLDLTYTCDLATTAP